MYRPHPPDGPSIIRTVGKYITHVHRTNDCSFNPVADGLELLAVAVDS